MKKGDEVTHNRWDYGVGVVRAVNREGDLVRVKWPHTTSWHYIKYLQETR